MNHDGLTLGNLKYKQSKVYKQAKMATWSLEKFEQNNSPFKKQRCDFRCTPCLATKYLDTYFKEHGNIQVPKSEKYHQLLRWLFNAK
jgi:hypothetical protein